MVDCGEKTRLFLAGMEPLENGETALERMYKRMFSEFVKNPTLREPPLTFYDAMKKF